MSGRVVGCNPAPMKGACTTPLRVTKTPEQGAAALPEYKRHYKKNIKREYAVLRVERGVSSSMPLSF